MTSGLSPVFAYLRQPTMVDYPGRLAAVFFTSGCNFRCGFCHNATLMGRPQPGLAWEKLDAACRKFKAEWVTGAAITGGEPSLSPEMGDLIAFFRERGLSVKMDSNGSHPDRLAALIPALDCVAMDVKAPLEDYPAEFAWAETERIRESIALVKAAGAKGVLRTTIMHPFHTDERMRKIGELIDGAAVYQMQAFVPRDNLPGEAYRTLPRTTVERLEALRELMKPYAGKIVIRGG